MCKKLFYLTFFYLVLTNAANAADTNLIGWWKLDEGSGTVAVDASGNGNDGTVYGDPQWITGWLGGALEFDGVDDYVDLPIGSIISSLTNSTFTIWVDFSNTGGAWQRIWDFGSGQQINMFLTPRMGTNGPMRFAMTTTTFEDEDQTTAPATLVSGWHHVAVVIDIDNTTHRLYLDGDLADENTAARYSPSTLGETTQNWLGRSQYVADAYYSGSLDDFQIYNYALSAEEIHVLLWGPLTLSWRPYPKDNSIEVLRDVILSWWLGSNADKHDVYLGTDVNDVDQASRDNPLDVLVSQNQDANTYDPDGLLDYGQTYYWRIDEVNDAESDSPWKGNVWSFTTINFLVVDDFEGYDANDNQIWYTWKDGFGYGIQGTPNYYPGNGTGSAVGDESSPTFMETTTVHTGNQSCPFMYNNMADPMYSEILREWETAQDWIVDGVVTLTLFFYGAATNSAEPLYVALEDNAGAIKVVTHTDAAAVQVDSWQQWDISLSQFSDAGVDLTAVKKMYIGVGNRIAPQMGSFGFLLFDDIRLYRP